jgi:N-formylglutamate deformylase
VSLFRFTPGESPLLLSVPHAGTALPDGFAARLRPQARKLPDTDWQVGDLYDFAAELGCGRMEAHYSRYVIDLNRSSQDESLYPGQATTGLCPVTQFDGTPIYVDGAEPDAEEIRARVAEYWQPYHDTIAAELVRLKDRYGFAVLWDCHSIASRVPRLFDGTLPVFNLGSVHGASASGALWARVVQAMEASGYACVHNGRFVGGHITRSFGKPAHGFHGLQMEIGSDAYMTPDHDGVFDSTKAAPVRAALRTMIEAVLGWKP